MTMTFFGAGFGAGDGTGFLIIDSTFFKFSSANDFSFLALDDFDELDESCDETFLDADFLLPLLLEDAAGFVDEIEMISGVSLI